MSVHLSYDSLLRNSDMPGGATALTAQVPEVGSMRRRHGITSESLHDGGALNIWCNDDSMLPQVK